MNETGDHEDPAREDEQECERWIDLAVTRNTGQPLSTFYALPVVVDRQERRHYDEPTDEHGNHRVRRARAREVWVVLRCADVFQLVIDEVIPAEVVDPESQNCEPQTHPKVADLA